MTGLGLIQVYTGNGKGKTTAGLGLAFRAIGHGFKVCIVQFMKETGDYGEVKAAYLLPGLTITQAGRKDFVDLTDPAQKDIRLAEDGWQIAREAISSGDYQIVIMDEINVAMGVGLLPVSQVVDFINMHRGHGVEMVLTGRYAPQEIMDTADLVTEMREVRHPFSQGVPSRQGIDY